jgi:uncharacterized membrane protein
MSPVVECRGSIPYGLLEHMPVSGVFAVAFLANTLMGIIVYECVKLLKRWLLKYPKLNGYYQKYLYGALKRFRKYETGLAVSLALFVGIPLPGTGAFTGGVIAEALDVKRPLAWISIAAGVLIACVVVTAVTWSAMQIAR